ncbi:MAG: hypothetical protein ACKO5J_01510, partial [Rubrivivax sp.]
MKRRRLLQGAAATAALGPGAKALSAASPASAPAPRPPGAAGARKVLRLALAAAETILDPPQTNSDSNTVSLLANILEAPLSYDYLARP